MSVLNYENAPIGGGRSSVKWSALGLAGRQGVVALFSLVLARLLGPEAYGLVAQATIYISLTTLLLDQGLATALMRAGQLPRSVVGAAVTLNLCLAVVLGGMTAGLAWPIANFFGSPPLQGILLVLGAGLLLKAAAIVPRMLLSRALDFRRVAVADLGGTLFGGLVGLLLALKGLGYWSLVAQTLVMDLVTAFLLILAARPPLPNTKLRSLVPILSYSSRVFGSNIFAYAASNSDSILIGRFLGAHALAAYDVAYRFLRLPVVMTGEIVNRVLLPLIAGKAYRGEPVGSLVRSSLGGVSFATFPLMAFVAVAASDLVPTILGEDWGSSVPILVVFAISGARQSVTTVNTPVLLGLGFAKVQFRFSVIAAATQVAAIAVGLRWGLLGVAVGYTVAGFLLTPAISALLTRYADVSVGNQLMAIAPALHGSIWIVAAYWAMQKWATLSSAGDLALGCLAATLAYSFALVVFHRDFLKMMLTEVRLIVGGRSPK